MVDNDQSSYQYRNRIVRSALRVANDDRDDAVEIVRTQVKEWLSAETETVISRRFPRQTSWDSNLGARLVTQLFTGAMSAVDWHAIARAWVEENE